MSLPQTENRIKIEKILNTEEVCYQGKEDAPNYCPLLSQFKDWATARNKAVSKWERDLRKKVSETSVADKEKVNP
jgi:hypothetical protein